MNVVFSRPKSFAMSIAQSVVRFVLWWCVLYEGVNSRFLYKSACGYLCVMSKREGESGANLSMQMRVGTLL